MPEQIKISAIFDKLVLIRGVVTLAPPTTKITAEPRTQLCESEKELGINIPYICLTAIKNLYLMHCLEKKDTLLIMYDLDNKID